MCSAKNATSWLDHALCSEHVSRSLSKVYVDYESSLSNHFPLQLSLDFSFKINKSTSDNYIIENMVNWNEITEANKVTIRSDIDNII